MNKTISLMTVLTTFAFAGGYKIPEQSGDSIATLASNVATSFGADAAYYNPANMIFLDPVHYLNLSSTYLHISSLKFKNESDKFPGKNYDTKSESANFYVPGMNFISPFLGDFRFGIALATPAGVGMNWEDPYPKSIAEKFYLRAIELAPSVAYKVNDNFAIGAGVRAAYAEGKVRNSVSGFAPSPILPVSMDTGRDMKGDSVNFGYNLAATFKPNENLSFAATYRSKINLKLKGDAIIKSQIKGNKKYVDIFNVSTENAYSGFYDGDVKIDIPLPAVLTLATSFELDDFTFLFAYDRTFWSAFKELDFRYDERVPVSDMFDKPIEKNWHDTNTYRFGVAYKYNPKLRLMGGFAIDESAADSNKVRFELPETKAYIYSAGANYKVSENFGVTGAFFYQDRQKRHVNSADNVNFNNVVGTFERNHITFLNLSFDYNF